MKAVYTASYNGGSNWVMQQLLNLKVLNFREASNLLSSQILWAPSKQCKVEGLTAQPLCDFLCDILSTMEYLQDVGREGDLYMGRTLVSVKVKLSWHTEGTCAEDSRGTDSEDPSLAKNVGDKLAT